MEDKRKKSRNDDVPVNFTEEIRNKPLQILISQVNAIAFVAMPVFLRSYTGGGHFRHTKETQFSYNINVTGEVGKLMLSGSSYED